MRYRLLFALISLIMTAGALKAQERVDTIYNPPIVYTGLPTSYEIADIRVTGADNYEDYIVIGYSGLKKGDKIDIPGDDVTTAVKRLMRQGLFAQAQVLVEKMADGKVWLVLNMRTQPRISDVKYSGMKKGEREDLQKRLQLMKGNQITQNIVNRAEQIVKQYFKEKGFGNADVKVWLQEDLSHANEMIVNIDVDKHQKVKVHKIYISGNEVLSDRKLKRVIKKTNESGDLLKLFSQKKFVDNDYKDDLNRILEKYNELGYRDAKIVSDSVVPYDDKKVDVYIDVDEGKKYYISDISWVGNTIYNTDQLNYWLGMKPGDVYNQKELEKRLNTDEDAVSSAYMDRGYLFYQLVPIEKNIHGDSIDLELRMFEGPQATVNKVVITGNDRLYEKVVRRDLRVKPGQLFSKSDLIRSVREIAQTGHFNPETMDPRVEPNQENGTVDVLFNLESKANDQIEFSLGWGQTGIIGKVALKFTNFSMKNLFNPSSFKGLIPQGEGQTFTISAQTNARYYQMYSVSFLDPWFGGKRPNSLQVSAYYSRQTGVNSSYYNSNWANPYLYGGYGYGLNSYYGNNYYNDYYTNSIQNAYDPNKVLQMAGVTVGFGKRLNWPDDYFTFTTELSYNWYYLKNWEYLYYMNNGTSNALVLGLTLARSSIDNPLYTRRGSTFSLNLSLTPPASLFQGKKDWEKLYNENTVNSKKELYRWIEYWKLRFKSRTYTPLTDPDGKWTLVLMTRADIGLLGSYNKWLKSPFETFYVGGDGMSGSYTYATETIALRGYENGALTPWGREGYAYTRFGVELHFPFMLQPTTTIYGLAFVEGGNAWTSVKEFSPFNMKRSAGAGVRIFLPMVGLMGIDWAYGFDTVFGQKGGSHFHFILGQEF
ncbi:MAG: outer membrane protein assembly factor BamA [Muribaculaceae bacterium]|nr:outer membrane protein assembly factor BamA [Muribaculaceae bacterium]MDE6629376.1 outer membrane protein assembly factor BamA [Muribaculaceae bacterium]